MISPIRFENSRVIRVPSANAQLFTFILVRASTSFSNSRGASFPKVGDLPGLRDIGARIGL